MSRDNDNADQKQPVFFYTPDNMYAKFDDDRAWQINKLTLTYIILAFARDFVHMVVDFRHRREYNQYLTYFYIFQNYTYKVLNEVVIK